MNINMLTESPQKALLNFSLPLLIGSIFQNLYNTFDALIVGRSLGKEALSAVGNAYVPTLIINSVLLGVSSGILILMSQFHGLQEQEKIHECIGSVQAMIVIIGSGLTMLSFIAGQWIFSAMNIPENIIALVHDYWYIVVIGIPFLAIHNFYSAIMKAAGNSQTPMRSIGFSCCANIFMDILFVNIFYLGVRGVAMATVISQAIAAGIVIYHLRHHDKNILSTPPNFHHICPIFKLSLTGVVQNGASAASMLYIQRLINKYGVNTISAYTAAYKIESLLTLPAVNLGTALNVFVGQNIGAKNIERTKQGFNKSFKLASFGSLITIATIWIFSPMLMRLFVGNEWEVIQIGVKYLHIISFTFPFCFSLYLLTNFLRGSGEVAYPLFNTILELSVRTVLASTLSQCIGFTGILLCRPISFIISTVSLFNRYMSKKWAKSQYD
jgi:putative MATE family efflux protein